MSKYAPLATRVNSWILPGLRGQVNAVFGLICALFLKGRS
jgi:hypothetical protein